jgi:pimeloyl-ACP methyl ester carboxylesterase
MATFVLVHGAWEGGWAWKRVRPLLASRGHEVFTPTLTGQGERSHLAGREVALETHITDVLNVLRWEDLSEVVLCGHSYGGMIISGVADAVPERIRSLVYIDAFLPRDGQSLMDQMSSEATQRVRDSVRAAGDGWRIPPFPAVQFKVTPENQEWVERNFVPQPLRTFQDKIRLTGALDRITKRTFILATEYQPSAFHGVAERLRQDPAWRVAAIDCGHMIQVDRPRELADALLSAV